MDVKEKRLDIIVLGATGFSGREVVKKLVDFVKQPEYRDLTWGVAGRSRDKLAIILDELQQSGADSTKIPVFECDIMNKTDLNNLTRQSRVLMNATGPYEIFGASVVEACIETATDYVDMSAELHYMLNIYQTFHEAAEKANVLIIPACGFMSLPPIAGLIHLEKNFQGILHTVECYCELGIPKRALLPGPNKALVHYGTWESMVHVMENYRESQRLKQTVFPEIEPVPEAIKKSFFHRHGGKVWIPYPGPDQDIVSIDQCYLHAKEGKQPYHFKAYATTPSFIQLMIFVPALMLYYHGSRFKCFRKLLWKHPKFFTLGYFSHKGPSEKMRNDMTYNFTLNGTGWDESEDCKSPIKNTLSVKVSGRDPGYGTTAVSIICSAITILKDRAKMPKGGVVTPGGAFLNTHIINRLSNSDCMKLEIIKV